MQHFYDGQIRRYLTQTIRVLSNFTVRYGDGTLHRVPVMYGDSDRQAASIVRQNSENAVNSAPRIAVYISALELDKERLSDATYVGKLHFRERDIDTQTGTYNQAQGKNYTVERLMPTPFKLTMKCDIWSMNTDQKLQILEQILVLFNPSLELQTTDNYIDWTSLSVLSLNNVLWSSRTVPVGNDTPIDVATLTLDAPVWISPPVKVKHLGVVTNIINSLYQSSATTTETYLDGLGIPLGGGDVTLSDVMSQDTITISDYGIQVYNGQAVLLGKTESVVPPGTTLEIPVRQGTPTPWDDLFNRYPGKYHAGSSRMFLRQPDGTDVIGTIAITMDPTILQVNWDPDTYPKNYGIDSNGFIENIDVDYNLSNSIRPAPGTFDAIIDPNNKGPRGSGLVDPTTGAVDLAAGTRYLIVEDIGNINNEDGPDAWKNNDGSDFIARANDIIEWDGDTWHVIFDSNQKPDIMMWQTNIYTGVQYVWNGIMWGKSFEGEYKAGQWRIVL